MENINIKNLLEKLRAGDYTAEEEAAAMRWLHGFNMESNTGLSDEELFQASDEMWDVILKERKTFKKIRLWPRIAAAAAILLVLGTSLWFYNSRHPEPTLSSRANAKDLNDIAPGHNGATLTLANGKVIALSDKQAGVIIGNEKLTYNDGSDLETLPSGTNDLSSRTNDLSSRANAKDLTATTAKGQTYQITLPDGTKAWLNAASKLEFPSNFGNKVQRIVKLKGEAYFEVAKNKSKPFIVESDDQRVEVLGTHFNVSAYNGEAVKTTLLEGAVRIAPTLSSRTPSLSSRANAKDLNAITLRPNQQSLVTAGKKITVAEVDPTIAIAWKNNEFMFEDQQIEQVMKMVERWYNVEIIYQGDMPKDKFGGVVSRFDKVSKVLSVLESTGRVHFKIEDRKIYVSK